MDLEHAISAFAALSQKTRLKVFKILIEYGKSGTSAGTISDRLGIPHNTLSFHLSHLTQAGLISARKDGRSMIYEAKVSSIEALISYLRENCCILEEGCKTDCNTTKRGKK
ncbi:MAG: metalloregulator ArsR/SmtB family transcription factor [Verrucomicrobiota bacterium]